MADRPMHPPAAELAAQAYDAFGAWVAAHEEVQDLDLLDQIEAYYAAHTAGLHHD